MKPSIAGVIALTSFLIACISDEGRFSVNGNSLRLSPAKLENIRRAWSSESIRTGTTSSAGKDNIQWTMDFIATLEAGGVSPCNSLELLAIATRGLKPIMGKRPSGEPLSFTPKNYNEIWTVNACGTLRKWQVFDEATDTSNPHRVILSNAA